GYTPGVYRATLVIQSQNAMPQSINVPVMFVLGPNTSDMTITAIGNTFSGGPKGAPGMLLAIYGKNLAKAVMETAVVSPKPYTTGGVTAAVNGIAAPVLYVSPTQVNIQIPYDAGAGPAASGLNNDVQTAATAPGLVGVLQVNYIAPANAPLGEQTAVVTIGGASASAKVTVAAN